MNLFYGLALSGWLTQAGAFQNFSAIQQKGIQILWSTSARSDDTLLLPFSKVVVWVAKIVCLILKGALLRSIFLFFPSVMNQKQVNGYNNAYDYSK